MGKLSGISYKQIFLNTINAFNDIQNNINKYSGQLDPTETKEVIDENGKKITVNNGASSAQIIAALKAAEFSQDQVETPTAFVPLINIITNQGSQSDKNILGSNSTTSLTKPDDFYIAVRSQSQAKKTISLSVSSTTAGLVPKDKKIFASTSIGLNESDITYIPIQKAVLEYVSDSSSGSDFIQVKSGGYLPSGLLGEIADIQGTLDEASVYLSYTAVEDENTNGLNIEISKNTADTDAGYISSEQGSLTNNIYTVNPAAASINGLKEASAPTIETTETNNSNGENISDFIGSIKNIEPESGYFISLKATAAESIISNNDFTSVIGNNGYLKSPSQLEISARVPQKTSDDYFIPVNSAEFTQGEITGDSSITPTNLDIFETEAVNNDTNINLSKVEVSATKDSSKYYFNISSTASGGSASVSSGAISTSSAGFASGTVINANAKSKTINLERKTTTEYINIDKAAFEYDNSAPSVVGENVILSTNNNSGISVSGSAEITTKCTTEGYTIGNQTQSFNSTSQTKYITDLTLGSINQNASKTLNSLEINGNASHKSILSNLNISAGGVIDSMTSVDGGEISVFTGTTKMNSLEGTFNITTQTASGSSIIATNNGTSVITTNNNEVSIGANNGVVNIENWKIEKDSDDLIITLVS